MKLYTIAASLVLISMATGLARAQTPNAADAAYIAKISTGAPAAVVSDATIVEMQKGGAMRTIQTGANGFTCMMVDPTTPMCADKNAMAWLQAFMGHSAPPDSVGFVYMLAGDGGTSNTDPYATSPSADNHWIKTGPHVMIVGPLVKSMGYPMAPDADPTKPFVMWPNTPYAHLMIPVSSGGQ